MKRSVRKGRKGLKLILGSMLCALFIFAIVDSSTKYSVEAKAGLKEEVMKLSETLQNNEYSVTEAKNVLEKNFKKAPVKFSINEGYLHDELVICEIRVDNGTEVWGKIKFSK